MVKIIMAKNFILLFILFYMYSINLCGEKSCGKNIFLFIFFHYIYLMQIYMWENSLGKKIFFVDFGSLYINSQYILFNFL